MSTTSLVRSTSSSNTLARSSSTSNALVSPQASQSKSRSSVVTPNTSLPKLQSTPQTSPATLALKSTPPPKQTPSAHSRASPANTTPGRWRHPRMAEIAQRQNRTNFDKRNTAVIIKNTLILGVTLAMSWLQGVFLPTHFQRIAEPYTFYIYLLLRTILLANIGLALAPLFRKVDACEDIPLTPHQRQLLGLPPMTRSATPQEQAQYITPPRLSRSATPASGNSSLFVQASGSPTSGSASPLEGRRSASNSPFTSLRRASNGSPFAPSPLGGSSSGAALLKGLGGGDRRRLSYTSTRSSPMSASEFEAAGGGGSSSGGANTPTKGHRASVGLNSKWLYEKGRASPNMWGTGSVFS